MANVTHKASTRRGGKAGPNSRRVSVTMPARDFEVLREIAASRRQTIGGTAAEMIASALKVVAVPHCEEQK